ncbi:MAG: 2-succinyl-6-hydroxy-2,4-cyclohexadiene-1-carboxylate synthase [bacterium]|nr:2-succinyl-6-hydroxy-2,4-cyclohexadiene-1-carboxylate synthase [bacterium]
MNKTHLSYLDTREESKPSVLFLHGFMGNANDWSDLAGGLSDRFRTIAVDLPGHGQSLRLAEDSYAIDGCADELIALLDQLELQKVDLVGYSMGGRIALYLAVHYPDRVEKLVLESATAGLKEKSARLERIAQDEEKAALLEKEPFAQFLTDWYQQPLFSSVGERPELMERLLVMRQANDPLELARSLRSMGTGRMGPLWDALDSLTVPTICLAGERDPKFAALARQMAVAIPNCHAQIIPEAGHIVHLEQPQTYIARVSSFLSA